MNCCIRSSTSRTFSQPSFSCPLCVLSTSHIRLTSSLTPPQTILHESSTTPYVVTALALYLFDRLLRLAQTRLTYAQLRVLPALSTVRLVIPTVNAGWRAGQHVRVKVLTTGMGWWGWAESHPFTIASCAEGVAGEGEGLVLLCKNVGKWGERLMVMARRAEYCEAGGGIPRVRVLVDGPYGERSSVLGVMCSADSVVGR